MICEKAASADISPLVSHVFMSWVALANEELVNPAFHRRSRKSRVNEIWPSDLEPIITEVLTSKPQIAI